MVTNHKPLGYYNTAGKLVNPPHQVITHAECRVLRALASGVIRKVIATELRMNVRTVESHICHARIKLRRAGYDTDTEIALLKAGIEIGIVSKRFLQISN